MLCLLNLLGARAVPQFLEICSCVVNRALGLQISGTEFLVLQANDDLSLFHFVTLLDADPGEASRDLRVHVDGVVRHDVTRGREDCAAGSVLGGFRRCPNHFHLRDGGRKRAIGNSNRAQQGNDGNADEYVAARPRGRFSTAIATLGAVDTQALKILVFDIHGHKNWYALVRS